MAVIELIIRQPEWFTDNQYWQRISADVMDNLYKRFGVIEHYEVQCGWQLDSFLTDDELRRLTLHVFGSTLPAMVERVKQLVIVGDGDCPKCGSSARSEITGGYEKAQFKGDYGGFTVLGWKCLNCDWEDYR